VKESFEVTHLRPHLQSYRPLSARLEMYYKGATPPRPDPGHLPSVLAGVSKRVAIETPKPSRKLRREFSRFVALWLRRNLRPLTADECLTFDQWLDETTYSTGRKEELRKVWNDCGGKPTKRMLSLAKCFVKDETYPEFKFPRGIYSRSDAAKCCFGPLVASVSKKVFALPWFIKYVPVRDRPMAIYDTLYKPGSKYMFTDYTAFEAHFTKDLMSDCENQLFRYMTKNLPDLRKIADLMASCKTGINHLIFKLFNCKMQAGRLSGEMDTSLSNGFTNLMLYLFASYQVGCPEEKIKGFVEGDDGLFRNDGPMPTEELFEELGMTIKIGIADKLEHASFCGQVYDVEDKTVVTDIQEQVCRLGWTNKKYVRAKVPVLRELLRARGYSLVYQYGACPILGKLGSKILELTSNIEIRESIIDNMDLWEKNRLKEAMANWKNEVKDPGVNTRILVEQLYNISVSEQIDIETKIESMTELGPLPFQFREVHSDWLNYHEKYSSSELELPPDWIPSQDKKLIGSLFENKAVTVTQYQRLLRGGC